MDTETQSIWWSLSIIAASWGEPAYLHVQGLRIGKRADRRFRMRARPPLVGSNQRPQALATYVESMRKPRRVPGGDNLSGHGEQIVDTRQPD
jgi:hypothetical protein